ncbi:purine nucleoside phosphorylase LACC1 isoform X1 [Lissotriton helveticus]
MAEAVLIDVFDIKLNSEFFCDPKCMLNVFKCADENYGNCTKCVYIMCSQMLGSERNGSQEETILKAAKNFQVLKHGFEVVWNSSKAAVLYSIKQKLDKADVNIVNIILPQSAVPAMDFYVDNLFTAVYRFEFKILEKMWKGDGANKSTLCQKALNNEEDVQHAQRDITKFLGSLQGLMGNLTILKSSLISDSIFIHGFTTREGGISYIATLSSLNLFSSSKRKDPKAVVTENLHRLAKAAGFHPDTYRPVKVDHANEVWIVGKQPEPDSYDGIVTNRKGITIAAPGADCIPLLFSDPLKKVCGAAHSDCKVKRLCKRKYVTIFLEHREYERKDYWTFNICTLLTIHFIPPFLIFSGWKGTLLGVAMATVNAMVAEYGCSLTDIVVVMGPSVGPCCFTLPQEDAKAFHAIDPKCVRLPDLPEPYIDIRRATRVLLERGGVLPQNIQDDSVADKSQNITLCTSCHPEKFFSNVRDGINFGTQICFITIKD